MEEIEEMEIMTTEEDIDKNDPENNENKKYDESRIYYVYEHIRLDKMEPFYIGKGKGERAYDLYRNDHHDAITDEYGHAVVIIADNLTEEEAFWLERDTIEDYVFNLGYGIDIEGHNDYYHELPHLTNMDWGGIGGKSGVKCSEETRRKRSESMKGKKQSEEARRKNSESHKGKIPWNKGKKGVYSEEVKQKMGEPKKGKETSEKQKQKVSKKVTCINTGVTFNSIKDASFHYGTETYSISACCKGKREHAGKLNGVPLQWKYAEEDDDNESKAV